MTWDPVHRRGVALILAALAIAWVAVILLLPYGGRTQPSLSFDTPYYVWRTRALAAEGPDVLQSVPTGGVPERPGYPSVAALLGSVTGADALTMTVVLRALAAIAIGLAAGVFAVYAMGAPAWTFAAFTVGVGASAAVVGTAVGSLDQLLADVFLMAAAAIVPPATRIGRGFLAIGLLIAAAAITHWVFTGSFVVLLLVFGGALLIAPWAWGEDRPPPSARRRRRHVLLLLGSAAGGLALALLLLPALPTRLPPASGGRGNLLRLGFYELPVLLPLAALGFVLGLRRFGDRARSPLVLAGVWAATVPVALVVSWLLPMPLKLFRVAPFALGVPLLATLALVVMAILLHTRGPRSGAIAGAAIVVVGLVLTTGSPRSTFSGGGIVGERIVQARAAAAYLDDVRWGDRPAVVLTPAEPRLLDRAIKSAVPPARIVDTWVFVGGPADLALVDSAPAELSDEAKSWLVDAWPSRPSRVLERDPIVIRISGTSRQDAVELAPGVTVVSGPAPDPAFQPPPPYAFGWVELLTATFAALAVLIAIGWGWARALLDVPAAGAFGLTPALGLATLAVAGTFAARLGVPLVDAGAIGVVIGTAASGWALFLVRRSVSRRRERRSAERPPASVRT